MASKQLQHLPGYTGHTAGAKLADPYEDYKKDMAEISLAMRGNIFGPSCAEMPIASTTITDLA